MNAKSGAVPSDKPDPCDPANLSVPYDDLQACAAEVVRLEALLAEAIEFVEEAQSGYISGSGSDMRWTARRDAWLKTAKATS